LKTTFNTKFKNPDIRVTVETSREDKIKQAEYDTVAHLSTLWDRRKDRFNEKVVIDVKTCVKHLNFYKVPKNLWSFTPKQSDA
jgi:hypothetical protein